MGASLNGTLEAYLKNQRPYSLTVLPDRSEFSIGIWLQLKLFEVVYLTSLLNVWSIQRAYLGSEHLVVEKNGLPVVVILSFKDYEEMRKAAALQNLQELSKSLNRKAHEIGLTEEDLEKKVE